MSAPNPLPAASDPGGTAAKLRPFLLNSNRFAPGARIRADTIGHQLGLDNNTGNAYITYSLLKTIYGRDKVLPEIRNMFDDALDDQLVDRINSGDFTHLFVIFQSHIGEHAFALPWGRLRAFIEKITIPIVVFSLGAISPGHRQDELLHEKIPEDMRACLLALSARTVSLGVRGSYTESVLKKIGIGNSRIVGCPTYFEMGRDRRLTVGEWNEALGVVGLGWFDNAARGEKIHYIFQDSYQDAPFFKGEIQGFEIGPEDLASLGVPVYDRYIANVWKAFVDGRTAVFADIDDWKDYIAGRFALAIGTRFHGGVLAINSGVPAIVTNGDPRAQELCEFLGVPYRPDLWGHSTDLDLRRVYEQTDFAPINARYAGLYDNYMDWLGENGVTPQIEADAPPLERARFERTPPLERLRLAARCAEIVMARRDARIAELFTHAKAMERGYHDVSAEAAVLRGQVAELQAHVAELQANLAELQARLAGTDPEG
jgi:hypothetical protein